MSPTATKFEGIIGRGLKVHDVLVKEDVISSLESSAKTKSYFEVVDPHVPNAEFRPRFRKIKADGIRVRELTPHGPSYKEKTFVRKMTLGQTLYEQKTERIFRPAKKDKSYNSPKIIIRLQNDVKYQLWIKKSFILRRQFLM